MKMKKKLLAVTLGSLFTSTAVLAEPGEINFFGNVYAKFLDGDRHGQDGLYNEAEFGGGDQGQGIEFELMFESQVTKAVEVGGRLKGRFNKNYWTNFGGFGGGCTLVDDTNVSCTGESDPREAQYLKVRGVFARVTPGYDWIDSIHVGSHDLGLWDAFTIGGVRYIDRDNASALIFQGSAANKAFRWDLARVSLPKLWAGPSYNTGDFHAQDSAWGLNVGYEASDDLNLSAILEFVDDEEIDAGDDDARDGIDTTNRVNNFVKGLKLSYSGIEGADFTAAAYHSDFSINNAIECVNVGNNGDCRFSPTLKDDEDDIAFKINVDLSDILADDLSMKFEYFHIGAYYQSIMAARRESDVLLTEGRGGSWGWWRPDYNVGNVSDLGRNQYSVGYGGWNGGSHQVATLNADNSFTDFDESMAESVIGWKGATFVTDWALDSLTLHGELTYIDYDTNWQACGFSSSADCITPRVEGTNSWGLGGAYRSVYSPYQERETLIAVLQADYLLEAGIDIDLMFKYKYMDDTDDRVLSDANLADAYQQTTVLSANHDDREAEYHSFQIDAGSQLTDDFYAKFIVEMQTVDLYDGTVSVTPPGADSWEGGAWIEYLTGDHIKYRTGVQLSWILPGVEFGLSADYLWGDYDPEFYVGNADGTISEGIPGAGDSTELPFYGQVNTQEVDINQYRMKAFMKVTF
ncbi:MAG: hypothetical protein AAGB12_12495 [Pseudomonadota bacterium]